MGGKSNESKQTSRLRFVVTHRHIVTVQEELDLRGIEYLNNWKKPKVT